MFPVISALEIKIKTIIVLLLGLKLFVQGYCISFSAKLAKVFLG